MKHLLTVVLAAALLLSLTSCGQQESPSEPAAPEAPVEEPIPAPPPPTREELEARQIQDLLDDMSLEERVGQLFFPRCPAESAVEDIDTYHLGGYLLFGRDFKDASDNWLTQEQLVSTLSGYQAAAEIPLLIGVDEEGGTVVRASRNPNLRERKFQSPQALFAQGGLEAILADTVEKDALLHSIGVNVNLAPVADLSTDPNDFIYDRSFGQNAEATSDYVSQVVAQMAADSMGSVLKHYPGYGSNVDTHTGIAVDERPMEQFQSADLLPFAAGQKAGRGTAAVLVSHNIITCMDPRLPASLSPAVHQVLRDQLGDVVAMTDDLAMEAVAAYAGDGSVAVMALEAGNDLIITGDYRTQIPLVIQAYEDGRLDLLELQDKCRRVLQWKQALGLLPSIAGIDSIPIV